MRCPHGSDEHCPRCRHNHLQRERRRRLPHLKLHDNAQRRARESGVPFTLTLDQVKQLLASGWVCRYCDSPVGSFTGNVRPQSATLDRLVPELGYTTANVVLACHGCNSSKAEHTPETLRAWADRLDAIIHRQNLHEAACTKSVSS